MFASVLKWFGLHTHTHIILQTSSHSLAFLRNGCHCVIKPRDTTKIHIPPGKNLLLGQEKLKSEMSRTKPPATTPHTPGKQPQSFSTDKTHFQSVPLSQGCCLCPYWQQLGCFFFDETYILFELLLIPETRDRVGF